MVTMMVANMNKVYQIYYNNMSLTQVVKGFKGKTRQIQAFELAV